MIDHLQSLFALAFSSTAPSKVLSSSRRGWRAGVALLFALVMGGSLAKGQTAVGSSTTQTVTVNFTNVLPVTLNATLATAIQVTTQGAPNLDFTYAAGGTCAAGGSYVLPQSCTVKVNFAPTFPGQRVGAVLVYDTNGALVGQTNTSGTGTGPLGVIEQGLATTLRAFTSPVGISTDSVGDIYLSASSRVYRESPNPDGTYTLTTLASGLTTPGGTVVDNAGNLYYTVRDDGTGRGGVYELTPDQQVAGGVAVEVAQGSFTPDNVLAADAAGNLYFADVNTFQIYKIAPGLPVLRGATVYSASLGERLAGLAVDPSGVIYAGGVTSFNIYKIAAGGGSSTVYVTSFVLPNGVALDAAGILYVNLGAGVINKYLPGSTSPVNISAGVYSNNGLAIDAAGTFYALSNTGALYVDRRTLGALAEPNATIGNPSAVRSTLLTNIGNAPLTPSALSATSPFSVDASGTCVVGTTVAPAASCSIASTFTPSAAQPYTGTVTLTDNSPASVATKTVNVTGTGQVGTLSNFTVTLPATAVAGTPVTATFQARDQNLNPLTSYNVTANLTSGDPQAVFPATVAFTNGRASATVTFNTVGGSSSIVVRDPSTGRQGSAFTTLSAPMPTILLAINPTMQTYGSPVALGTFTGSAIYNNNSIPGTYTYTATPTSGTAIVVTQGTTVLPASAYNVVATFTPTDTTNYAAASSNTTASNYTVTSATPAILFTVPTHTYGDAPFTVSASSASSGAFTYTVVSGPATISANTVTITGAGTVVLQASQAADANYVANNKQASFSVAAATAAISFSVANHTLGDAPFTVAATSSSTGAFTYTVVSGPATISGSTVTLTGAGAVVLQASQAAVANYVANNKQASFTVAAGTAAITFSVPNHTFGDAPFAVAATSSSTGAFTYTVVSGPATISGNTVTLTGAGAVVLQASQAADANYAAGTKTATFTVVLPFVVTDAGAANITVTVKSGSPAQTALTVTPSATFSGIVAFSCTGAPTYAACMISPATLTFSGTGTAQTASVTISTSTASALNARPNFFRANAAGKTSLATLLWLPGLLMAGFAGSSRKLRKGTRLATIACLLLTVGALACMTGCADGAPAKTANNTAAGTYTVTVTATSGSTVQTFPITLIVQ